MGSLPPGIPDRRTAYLALISVCFFWGTTYLGIRVALESFAILWLVATRFLLSGGVMLLWAVLTRQRFPDRVTLMRTALNGIITLGIANGALTLSETLVPSGLAALFVTTAPFWYLGIEALVPGGEPIHRPAILAMLVGLTGVLILVGPDALGQHTNLDSLWGFLILQVGNAAWVFGSIRQKRLATGIHPLLSGAIQQFSAGAVYLFAALVLRPPAIQWTPRGTGALLYLVVFGSIVAYSSYLVALERLPISIVSIYTYINPIVAVILGWAFYREPLGWREFTAMALIFTGVALVKRFSSQPAGAQPAVARR